MGQDQRVKQKEVGGSKDQFWNPRFWDGMTFCPWMRAMAKGKFLVAPSRICMAALITGLSFLNSFLAFSQCLFLGRKIRKTTLKTPPIFIIGHWRSGTTLLHEYMIRDSRFTYSDTYDCFAPRHFLISGPIFRPWVKFLMPKKRPMDNMAAGLDHPQEDEFALCGAPSPYLDILYPNNSQPIDPEYLTMRNIASDQRKKWLDIFEYFLKELTVAENKTVLLKSPPHTARIRTILERFPDAKFVHINRNPYTLFPSTYRLWIKLAEVHGIQHPKGKGLEEKILNNFEEMYDAFFDDIKDLKEDQFIDVSYDDLVKTPVDTMERIYKTLELDGFEECRQNFVDFAATQKAYRKNKFEISPEIAEKIKARWSKYLDRYGYTLEQ